MIRSGEYWPILEILEYRIQGFFFLFKIDIFKRKTAKNVSGIRKKRKKHRFVNGRVNIFQYHSFLFQIQVKSHIFHDSSQRNCIARLLFGCIVLRLVGYIFGDHDNSLLQIKRKADCRCEKKK